jgi:hypothetical protein
MSKLFCVHETVNYYLYRRPVKMSKSFDSLAALIRSELNRDIINGDVFLFLNRNRTMIKVLVYERKGYSIFYRRLDEGAFQLLAIFAQTPGRLPLKYFFPDFSTPTNRKDQGKNLTSVSIVLINTPY